MKPDEAITLVITPMSTDDTILVWGIVAILVLSWAVTLGLLFKQDKTIQDDNR